ncbi:MAG: glycosyltransferase family 39 protein [Candidatus Eremiobacterota bacterium]
MSKKEKKTVNKSIEKNVQIKHYWLIIAGLTLAGLLIRLMILALPEKFFYIPDHMNNWIWARHSVEYGLMERYGYNRQDYCFTYGPPLEVQVDKMFTDPDGKIYRPGDIVTLPGRPWKFLPVSYPPFYVYIRHIFGLFHRFLDIKMEPLTPAAWFSLQLPNYIADWILALGCLCTVRRWKGEKEGLIAFILMWFSPAVLLTGVLWTQCDSWYLALAVWCMYFLMENKWAISGIIWALVVLVKPQSLFMIPPLGYFFFAGKRFKPFLIYCVTALLAIMVITAPFMFKSGPAWISNTYLYHFTDKFAAYTTFKGFNIWMVDLILGGHDLNIYSTIFGISKKMWGLLFLITGLIISFIACHRRYKNHVLSLPMLLSMTFIVIFLFSTQVHERFIIYILPFILISAFIENNFRAIFAGYSIIGFFEVTHHILLPSCLNLIDAKPFDMFFILILSIAGICLFFYLLYNLFNSSFNRDTIITETGS